MLRALAERAPRPILARRRLRLLVGSSSRPHREKKDGEDAYFASAADNALGVADGVGARSAPAWTRATSRGACSPTRSGTPAAAPSPPSPPPRAATTTPAGAAAARRLVATLDGDRLEVCNFGDSACALLRPAPRRSRAPSASGRCALRTADQTHYFNCPYQASAADDLAGEAALGACGADALAATARAGDVVAAATDGFWDNASDDAARAVAARRRRLGVGGAPGASGASATASRA
ncbi:phosphoprotein phosphatase [Aureococcus anophagefferens]|nr:phosphoprotein phosphatase [Aureococcus anophagefferens]